RDAKGGRFAALPGVGYSVACLEWAGWESRPVACSKGHGAGDLCCLKPSLQKRLEGVVAVEENSWAVPREGRPCGDCGVVLVVIQPCRRRRGKAAGKGKPPGRRRPGGPLGKPAGP